MVSLTPDALDDLIYFSRTGDLDGLKELITTLCTTHACPPSAILASAIDVDEDGLGSQSSLLHYPAANGNLEIVNYLISLITGKQQQSRVGGEAANDESALLQQVINHKNVSGNTSLHWAGMNGHLEVVKALVGAGADPEIVNAAGRDAVVESECSAKEGAQECADWMLKNCEGLEKGVGGAERSGSGNDEGGAPMEDDEMVVEDAGEGQEGGKRDQET